MRMMKMSKRKQSKQTKPVMPKPSLFEYEPYIARVEREMKNMDKFLEDMRENRVAVNPQFYGCQKPSEVYNKIVDARNNRSVILRNWKKWVELSSPVLQSDDKDRLIEDLSVPNSYWYESDFAKSETAYFKRLTIPSGKWKEILSLRGHLLIGNERQAKILRKLYITVMEAYVYAKGFASIDKQFYVCPHSNWREKMGAIFIVNDNTKVRILK